MALQLRRLFPSSCLQRSLSNPCRLPSSTVQYRALQNFPCTSLQYTLLPSHITFGRPVQFRTNYSTLTQTRCGRINRLPQDYKLFAFYSSKPLGKPKVYRDNNKVTLEGSKRKPGFLASYNVLKEKSSSTALTSNPERTGTKTKKTGTETKKTCKEKTETRAIKSKKEVKPSVNNKEKTKTKSTRKAKTQTLTQSTKSEKNKENNEKKEKMAKKTEKKTESTKSQEKSKNLDQNSNLATKVETQNRFNKQKLGPLYPPSGKSVVVVESVTKAKVIQNYLGEMYEVLPSHGHVRDLAGRSRSVRPDEDFSVVWEVPAAAWTHLKSIKVALNGAQNLILASDPDREGEAIAWHITEMLHQQYALSDKITVARVVFHEITENAIKSALQSPRDININLVNAYLARRALDYLIGFSISPLLWRKLPGCASAGRVQSAALALICDRETEIDQFKPSEYWTVKALFRDSKGENFHSNLTHFGSKKLDQLSIGSEQKAKGVEQRVFDSKFEVIGSKKSVVYKNPPMPYITSSLQQDSANKLQFSATYTMKLAQKLYEGVKLSDKEATGLITYMRTDGLHISEDAAADIQALVKERYGEKYSAKGIRKCFKKVKNAQEAHEAIRPTNIRRLPSTLKGVLDEDCLKLYTLIWTRTMACQMEPSRSDLIQVDIGNSDGDLIFHSTGSRIGFLGFRAVYEDREMDATGNSSGEDNTNEELFKTLQKLKVKDSVNLVEVQPSQHFTKPPPRYSEGSLVKKLEELGIGRPSTYASTIKVLQDRKYVTLKSRVLHPEFRGRMVSAFLSHHFSEVANYSFTADMENELDNVSAGSTEWKGLLRDYWSRFSEYCELASKTNSRQVEKFIESKFGDILFANLPNDNRVCPSCSMGTLKFKVSRFASGYFIGCDQHPRCKYIAGTVIADDEDEKSESEKPTKSFPPKLLGFSPTTNEEVYLKDGPFGYYVQLGEDRKGYTPKRAAVSAGFKDIESVTLEDAMELFKYPLTLGTHPHDGQPVIMAHSKAGYSIKHRTTVVHLPKGKDLKEITLETGIKLLKSKHAKTPGRKRRKTAKLQNALG